VSSKSDAYEGDNGGPLFNPRLRSLSHVSDPATSVKAAAKALRSGVIESDAEFLVRLVTEFPGQTMEWLGREAHERLGCYAPFEWRLKLGRRTGTLKAQGLIHQDGELDGMARWWPGPRRDDAHLG
jgi:hypothetical protein